MIRKIFDLLKSLWRRLAKRPQVVAPKFRQSRQPKEHSGSHYYLGDLLDCLDASFEALRAIKKVDSDAYDYLSRVGAPVMNTDGRVEATIPAHIDLDNPPSVIAWACPKRPSDNDKFASPRMIYAVREKRPVNVQLSNRPVYRLVMAYVPKWLNGKCHATGGYVAVQSDGTIAPLKQIEPIHQSHRGKTVVTRMGWANPWEQIAKFFDESEQQFLTNTFGWALSANEGAESGLTVRVSRGRHAARFAINMLRTPYFFADRDRVVNERGSTKKIFHIVRGHWRTGAGGNKRWVKPHFRGLRKFTWNDYRVSISLPGYHYNPLTNLAAEGLDPRDPETPKDVLTMREAGERVARYLETS